MKTKHLRFLMLLLFAAVTSIGWADSWVKTDPTALQTGDKVVIVDLTSGRAMTNTNGTSSAPSATAISVSGDELAAAPAESLQWEVTVNGGNYKFGVSGTSNYLYCTSTNNGVRVGTNNNNTFTLSSPGGDNNVPFLVNSATSRYIGVYNSQDWRCYTSINNNIKGCVTAFFKYTTDSSKENANVTIGTTELSVGGNTTVTTDGPALTLTSNNTNVATVSGTTVTGAAAGYATITAAWDENDDFNGGTNTFDVTVKDADKGTEANPYTVAEALALIDNLGTKASWDVYVSGVVSRTTQYNSGGTITYYIYDAEGGEELQVYKGNGIDNVAFSAMTDLQPGDEVTVLGKLKLYNNSTKEFDTGNYLTAFNRPSSKQDAELAYAVTSITKQTGDANFTNELTNPNNLTVTYASNKTSVATVDENGEVTIVGAGTTTITASSAATDTYYAGSASYTLTVTTPAATLVTVDADGNTTFDLTQNDWGFPVGSAEKAVEEGSFSNSGYTIKVAGSNSNGYYYNTGYLMIGKAGAYLTLPAFDYDVDKIEVVGRSGASTSVKQNIYVGETAVSTETQGCTTTNTYEIAEDYQAAGNVYTLKLTSAHNTQITSIIVYKKAATPTVVDLTLDENDDNSAVLTANDGKTANVTIGRTISNASYSTLVLPFDVDATMMGEVFGSFNLYSYAGDNIEEGKLMLQFNQESAITAGVPYLILPAETVTNPVFNGVVISDTEVPSIGANATFTPNTNAKEIAASKQVMFLGAANTLYWNNANATMKGFRAYWQVTGDYSSDNAAGNTPNLPLPGVVTGITTITTDGTAADNSGWYTLDGRKLNGTPTQQGLYIHNGKKVIKK